MRGRDHRTFPRIRGTSPLIQQRARELRRRATEAERVLWERLRNRRRCAGKRHGWVNHVRYGNTVGLRKAMFSDVLT